MKEELGEGAFSETLLTELLKDALDSRAEEINTCLPAKVTGVDHEKQTVNVLVGLKRLAKTTSGDYIAEDIPEFLGVPLAFPRGTGWVMYVPPQIGDYVLLLFPQWVLSEWLRTGDTSEQVHPGDSRVHSMGSAVAIPGVFPSNLPVSGLSASKAILGNPNGVGLSVSNTEVKLGNHTGTTKKVAREGDKVRITITQANIATMALSNGGGTVAAGAPVTVEGTIIEGSNTVKASD